MHTELWRALLGTLALVVLVVACDVAAAQAFEGPDWSLGGESEITGSAAVHSTSGLGMTFQNTSSFAVSCKVTSEGTVKPENKAAISAVSATECKNVKSCTGAITVKAVHLPWNVTLAEVEEKAAAVISSSGAGLPGFTGECTVFGIKVKDECTGEITVPIEDVAGGVDFNFSLASEHLKCTLGGEGGSMTGTELYEATGKKLVARSAGESECNSERECLVNHITVSPKNMSLRGLHSQTAPAVYVNHNWWDTWHPATGVLNPVAGTPLVWSTNHGCIGHPVLHGQHCTEEVTYTGNGEAGLFIAELFLAGAPPAATLLLFGEG